VDSRAGWGRRKDRDGEGKKEKSQTTVQSADSIPVNDAAVAVAATATTAATGPGGAVAFLILEKERKLMRRDWTRGVLQYSINQSKRRGERQSGCRRMSDNGRSRSLRRKKKKKID
jgi:hypothetical protein